MLGALPASTCFVHVRTEAHTVGGHVTYLMTVNTKRKIPSGLHGERMQTGLGHLHGSRHFKMESCISQPWFQATEHDHLRTFQHFRVHGVVGPVVEILNIDPRLTVAAAEDTLRSNWNGEMRIDALSELHQLWMWVAVFQTLQW